MAGLWSAMNPLELLSDSEKDEEELGSDEDEDEDNNAANSSRKVEEPKKGALSYEELVKHGYSDGPSVLLVPVPKHQPTEPNWSWSGKPKANEAEIEEDYEERERTRIMANAGAHKAAGDAIGAFEYAKKQRSDAVAEQRALTFSRKEKRKRDLGQSSRGKNYVEEEKRLLRDRGVYSGFD